MSNSVYIAGMASAALLPLRVDRPNDRCSFHVASCTERMIGHGGLQLHHEVPKFLGGAENGVELTLCPSHHVRQHALIRYLIERRYSDLGYEAKVLRAYTRAERAAGYMAVEGWLAQQMPWPLPWTTPAAR